MCTIGWLKTDNGYIVFKNRDSRRADSVLSIGDIVKFGYEERKGCWLCVGDIAYASARGPLRRSFQEWKKYNRIAERVVPSKKRLRKAVDAFLQEALQVNDSFVGIFANKRKVYVLEIVKGKYEIEEAKKSVVRTNHFLLLEEFNNGFRGLNESQERLYLAKRLLQEKSVHDVLLTPGILRENTVATGIVEVGEEIRVFSRFYGEKPTEVYVRKRSFSKS